MRPLVLFTAITSVALISLLNSTAYAQTARGMNKHDASIANYGYTIPIITDTESAGGNLKQDLDDGKITPSGVDKNLGLQAPNGAPIGGTPANRASVSPLAAGTQAPEFALPSYVGGVVALKELATKGPTLVLFTPGTSTTAGLRPLQLIQRNLKQFEALGINVVAITPEPLNVLQMAQQRNHFGFHILNDQNNEISSAYGVLRGYEPVPSLFSIDAAGKIAAVQVQQNNSAFDLKLATDPLRGQTQAAVAPAAASQDPDMAAPALVAPSEEAGAMTAPVMPAVPSPMTNKDVPPTNVPKVSYDIPPSNPAFKGHEIHTGLAI